MTSTDSIQDPQAMVRPTMRIMDPLCEPGWDRLVEGHSNATFFHSAAWARTLSATYGFNCRYITATSGEKLHALLPLMEARSWLRGTRGVALPFSDECPALHSTNVRAGELLDEAIRQGKARRWKYLEIRGGLDSFQDVPEFNAFFGHVLDLNAEPRTLLDKCESAVGRAVRKAEREGVSVAFGTDLDSMRAYYKLHCRTRAKLGAPPQPFRFFEAICRHVLQAGHGFVALASYHGRAIAGAVFFHFARKAIYKFSASDERFQHFRGPNLVIWSALEKLMAAGNRELNFGRTDVSNEGLRRFKRGWGSREYMIRYARYSFSPAGFMSGKGARIAKHTRILTMVPVALSRWIGRAVYPHLT